MDFIQYIENKGYYDFFLEEVLSNKNKHTYFFRIKGKINIAPKYRYKIIQKILKEYLTITYSSHNISNNTTAYLEHKNISYNLERHQGNNYFFVTDFKSFFTSIIKDQSMEILEQCLYRESKKSLQLIFKIIFYKNKLQYGFPTSPIISNFIMKKFDDNFQEILNKKFANNNVQFTRYSDDITISSKYKLSKSELLHSLHSNIKDGYSFLKINNKKTRFFEKYARVPYITGLIPLVHRTSIGKKKYNKLKSNLYLKLENEVIDNEDYFKTVASLRSYLSYLYLVDKHNYNRLKKSFHKYTNTEIFQKLFIK